MESSQPIQIFISYASQDQQRVLEMYSYLVQKVHPRIWMDCKNLLPGQQWEPEILKNLRQSEIILVFLSEVSVEKRGVVQRELNLVLKYLDEKLTDDIYIIPVKLDSQARVPDKLSHLQWVDLNAEGAFASIEASILSQLEKLDKPVFKSVTPDSDIQISKRVFTERWEGLPGYDGRFAIPILHSARFENLHEISRIVEASFIKLLHDYRQQKFYQESDEYDWSQPSGRRMNWFDAQLSYIYHENNVLSLVYAIYWYGAGAAHPNGYHVTYNFLLNPLIEIPTIRYLFQSPEEILPKLAQYYSNALDGFPLEEEHPSAGQENAESDTTDRWGRFSAFSFDPEGLRIYGEVKRFRETQYDVIPYSLIKADMKKTITYALSIAYL